MKTCLELLYKPFYSKAFIQDYVKNGKGVGVAYMAFLALIISIATTIAFFAVIRPVFNTETVNNAVYEVLKETPKIVIEDGELVWEDGSIEHFSPKDLDLDDAFGKTGIKDLLVVDTVNSNPSVSDIKKSVFYITKTDFYVNNKGEIKSANLKQIQELSGQNPFDMTSDENISTVIGFVQTTVVFLIIFIFVFLFLITWAKNVILSSIARFFAGLLSKSTGKMEFAEVRRLATACTSPVLLVVALSQLFFDIPGVFVGWLAIVILGTIIISQNSPSEKIETEEKIEKQ